MRIHITSDIPCAASIQSSSFFLCGTDKTVFSISEERLQLTNAEIGSAWDAILLLTPIGNSLKMPICAELLIEKKESGHLMLHCSDKSLYSVNWSGDATAEDLNEAVFELIPSFKRRCLREPPKLLQHLKAELSSGEAAELHLYSDDGLRLTVRSGDKESGYMLASGNGGTLRMLEVGFARMLVVHAIECRSQDEFGDSYYEHEELIVLNESFEIFGRISGDCCFIDEGVFTAIDELGTVLAHQRRLRYELNSEGLGLVCKADDVGEIGFFTHPPRLPKSEEDKALAFLECMLLYREDEAMELISHDLRRSFGFDGIIGFLGDFDEARIAPFKAENGTAIIGAVKEGNANAYSFEFENGLISDISELEPPFSPQNPKDAKETEA